MIASTLLNANRANTTFVLCLGLLGVAGRAAARTAAQRVELVSLLGRSLFADPASTDRTKLEEQLAVARREFVEHPNDPEKTAWVGRRLGYLWRMHDAIEVYSDVIDRFPDYAPLYRHRGHRYISVRRFDEAITDLKRAAELNAGLPDQVEPDGMPNARNTPPTTTAFNIWYHLGLAR